MHLGFPRNTKSMIAYEQVTGYIWEFQYKTALLVEGMQAGQHLEQDSSKHEPNFMSKMNVGVGSLGLGILKSVRSDLFGPCCGQ